LTKHARKHKEIWEHLNNKREGVDIYAQSCNPINVQKHKVQQSLSEFVARGFNTQQFEELLMKWVVANEQSFLVVENQHFKELIQYLNHKANTKTADTLRRKIKSSFDKTRLPLKEILTKNKSKYSFTTDIWTSPASIPFTTVTVHFIDEELTMNSLILDFVPFRDTHSGVQIASVFKNIVDEFEIKDKILAVCTDNASNNDSFIQDLLDNEYINDK
jgi:hypothetical protein